MVGRANSIHSSNNIVSVNEEEQHQQQQQQQQQQQPSCTSHWKIPMFSNMDIHGNKLDMKTTFQPGSHNNSCANNGFVWGAIKLIFVVWTMQVTIVAIYSFDITKRYMWPFYLTNWTVILTNVYFICGFLLHTRAFPFLDVAYSTIVQNYYEHHATLITRIVWSSYVVALVFGIMSTVLYWVLVYENWVADYLDIMPHGILVLFVIIDGMFINRIPIRIKHLGIVESIAILYLIWTVVYEYFVMDGDALLYDVLNWKDTPGSSAVLSLIIVCVATPVVFFLCWSISTFVVPSRYDVTTGTASTSTRTRNHHEDELELVEALG